MAKAGDLEVEFGELSERLAGLRLVLVEHAERPGRRAQTEGVDGGIAGEEEAPPGQVQRDAAGGVAGHMEDAGAAVEVDLVAVRQLPVDAAGLRPLLKAREEPGEQSSEAGRARLRRLLLPAHHRRIDCVREHLGAGALDNLSERAEGVGIGEGTERDPTASGAGPVVMGANGRVEAGVSLRP